jgi:hypothetical protein
MLKEGISNELNAIRETHALFRADLTRVPTDTDKQVQHLQLYLSNLFTEQLRTLSIKTDERFDGIKQQFVLRDTANEKMATAANTALSAALEAQEKMYNKQNEAFALATQKSEDSFTKQITALDNKIGIIADQLKATMTREEVGQLFRSVTDKLEGPTGLAMRLENVVARGVGREDQARTGTQTNQWLLGTVLGIAGLLVAIAALYLKVH